jgi:hypothetical protein
VVRPDEARRVVTRPDLGGDEAQQWRLSRRRSGGV